MLDTVSWTQIALIFGSSVLITVLVFIGLVWRDYQRDRTPRQ